MITQKITSGSFNGLEVGERLRLGTVFDSEDPIYEKLDTVHAGRWDSALKEYEIIHIHPLAFVIAESSWPEELADIAEVEE